MKAEPLHGVRLWVTAFILSMGCFAALLDLTVANVALPTISGSLGITPSQAVWVITSYAIAEGVTVPLTGWMSARFGGVRVMVSSMVLFGVFSLLCGVSTSLAMLVISRIGQGCTGGLMMTLSQTLLIRIFPPALAGVAMAAWSMPALLAPILGPLVGGWLCEKFSWPLIFFINIPLAAVCSVLIWRLVKPFEDRIVRAPVDVVGFVLLVTFVGALQIMLDLGKEKDWFDSLEIRLLAGVGGIGFIAFLMWELTERHPIVNLRVFRHRAFAINTTVYVLAFASTFTCTVITPLWLQNYMGYTSSVAGLAMSWNAVLAFVLTPLSGVLMSKWDGRLVSCIGFAITAFAVWMRSHYATDATYYQVVVPMLIMGAGVPLLFVPLITAGLRSVGENETASAAGLQNFLRTVGSAFAVSIATTAWDYKTTAARTDLSGAVSPGAVSELQAAGMPGQMAVHQLSDMVQTQSAMIALNQVMLIVALVFAAGAVLVWLTPKSAATARAIPPAH